MAIEVLHDKVLTVPDDGDTSVAQPSDWNAGHVVTGAMSQTDLADHAALTTGVHGVGAGTIAKVSDIIANIAFVIDGGGVAITTGVKGFLEVPFGCTVLAWTVLADVAGAIVVDVWNDTYANFPPTNADAMPGAGHEPTIAATAQKGQDTDASDWADTSIAAGSILAFNVDSCATITKATVNLKVQRT